LRGFSVPLSVPPHRGHLYNVSPAWSQNILDIEAGAAFSFFFRKKIVAPAADYVAILEKFVAG